MILSTPPSFVIIILLDSFLFWYTGEIREIVDCFFFHAGILFYLILAFGTFLVWRTLRRIREIEHPFPHDALPQDPLLQPVLSAPELANARRLIVLFWCLIGTALTMVYFLAIGIFAYTIYPFIPDEKGGGDYSASPYATVSTFSTEGNPGRLILLYRTEAALYFGKVENDNDPCDWRSLKNLNVLAIAQRDVKRIVYSRPNASACGFN